MVGTDRAGDFQSWRTSVPITIIGGAPGAGKTSLAHLLATSEANGVHVETDVFFRFVPHRVDPSLPAANDQNAAIARAYTRAAVEYSNSGYSVYLEAALSRVELRRTQTSATPDVIRRMHPQFAAAIPECGRRVIRTDERSLSEVANDLRSARAAGVLAVRP